MGATQELDFIEISSGKLLITDTGTIFWEKFG
jgi:hypothetical protein